MNIMNQLFESFSPALVKICVKKLSWILVFCQISATFDKVKDVIQTLFFIVPGYFTLRFYSSNYFYSSSEEDIELHCLWKSN